MRLLIAFLPVLIAAAFLVGRATSPDAAVGASTTHVYTGRLYDVFRVPAAAIRCEVDAEAGSVKLSCGHVPYAKARHDVVFYNNNILVYRLGNPANPRVVCEAGLSPETSGPTRGAA
jgi:hypothetical protein